MPLLAMLIVSLWFTSSIYAADWNICSDSSTTDGSGNLYDSGGAGGNYSNFENCSFLISPGGSPAQITLSFSSFNVEADYDELRVYDGTNELGTLLGTFDGFSLPADVVATSGSMYLVFTSDFSETYSGFTANWSSSGGSDSTPPADVTDLATGSIDSNSITLNWTAPGDDGNSGTADSYEVRYSTFPINDDNWSFTTPATGEPSPQAAGSAESFTVTGLNPDTTYYFAVRTTDEAFNESGLSNIASGTTTAAGPGSEWRICADAFSTDDSGTIYDSGGAGGNYSNNEYCSFLISPSGNPSEISLSFSAFNVESGWDYLRVFDGGDQNGTLLGVFSGSSLPADVVATSGSMYLIFSSDSSFTYSGFAASWSTGGGSDSTPPDAITDLSTGTVTSGSITLDWTAPGDDGSSGTATSYDVRYATSPIDDLNWDTATQATGEPSPGTAGSDESFTVTGLDPDTTYYFAIRTTDEAANESGLSNIASGTTAAAGTPSFWNICTDTMSTNASGILYDSGGATGNYGNLEYCTFVIMPSGGPNPTSINLSYNIQNGDLLQIWQGTDDSGPIVNTYTGSGSASFSATNVFFYYVVFTSDSSGTDSGFRIEWNEPGIFSATISGTIFEDVNYGGGPGRSQTAASGIGRPNATVELYDESGNYIGNTTTDGSGNYNFTGLSAGLYTVRVVNSTVTSSRSGATGAEVGVQTFRADGNGESVGTGTNRVGGEQPQSIDAPANGGIQTLGDLQSPAGQYTQSIVTVNASLGDVSDVDFGFNFDTIVNTNDSGQGSLRQFIANANLLANTGLDQNDWGVTKSAGVEHSIFMIPTTDSGYGADPTGGSGSAFVIQPTSARLPDITDADTAIDGRTQTAFTGDTNGAVANTSTGPEVVVDYGAAINDHHFRFLSVRGYLYQIGVYRGGDEVTDKGAIRFENVAVAGSVIQGVTAYQSATHGFQIHDSNNITISNNISRANGTADAGADGLTMTNGSSITITGNSFVGNAGWGIELWDGTCNNNVISMNYIAGNGASQTNGGIELEVGSQNTITQNTITANTGDGILIHNGATDNTISENAIYANSDLGIDLSADNSSTGDGVTVNDANDGDVGGNGLLNFPVITSAIETSGTVSVDFDLDVPAGDYRIEFFINPSGADPSGYGEGESFASAVSITHAGSGAQTFSHSLNGAVGDIITATATVDEGGGNYGSTSEFSAVYTATDPTPDISLIRSVALLSDPFNNTVNPKMIPGAVITNTVTVTNQGTGATDADTVIITNPVGSENMLFVGDLAGAGSGPVVFTDGATASGLTYTFSSLSSTTDSISFSDDNGASYTYSPTPDGDGYDANVTHLRVTPAGAFAASDGSNHPGFALEFRVRVR